MRRLLHALLIGVIAAGALVLIVLAPFGVSAVGSAVGLEWAAAAGQEYAMVSALLSGAGLCAVAYAAHLQTRQTRLSQLQAARMLQFELLRLSLNDPAYRVVLGRDLAALPPEIWREHAYLNLWLMYLQMAFLTHSYDERGIRRALSGEFFNGGPGVEHWSRVRPAFVAEATTTRHRAFVRVLDEEHMKATALPNEDFEIFRASQKRSRVRRASRIAATCIAIAVMAARGVRQRASRSGSRGRRHAP